MEKRGKRLEETYKENIENGHEEKRRRRKRLRQEVKDGKGGKRLAEKVKEREVKEED